MCQPGLQDLLSRQVTHRGGQLMRTISRRACGPLHRTARVSLKHAASQDKVEANMLLAPSLRSHMPSTPPYPSGYIVQPNLMWEETTLEHGYKEVRSLEPILEVYHTNSHRVCILHPSECQEIKRI